MLPNDDAVNEVGEQRFAVCLNEQGQFAATCVSDFNLLPAVGRHVWKGKLAETAVELAEQINGALKSLAEFGDPFKTLEVISVGKDGSRTAEGGNGEVKTSDIILEANRQLQEVIEQVTPPERKLRVKAA